MRFFFLTIFAENKTPMHTKINLVLPRSWNHCSTQQLELIANVLREQVERTDRYHPFRMENVKIALFFALTGIEIIEGPNPRVPIEEQYYTCRIKRQYDTEYHHIITLLYQCARWIIYLCSRWFSIGQSTDTFSLYLWQINYWLSPKVNEQKVGKSSPEAVAQGAGILDWLENENEQYLTKFPYPFINRSRSRCFSFACPSRCLSIGFKKPFQGPSIDLDGFTWSQYRLANDSMQNYLHLSNSLTKMKQMGTFSEQQMQTQIRSVDTAKAMFLSTIFNARVKFIETSTGIIRKDFHYESNQITDNTEFFRNFPDTQWQVILFWWTGIMHTLHQRYPHVFKVKKVEKKLKPSSAMEIYSATIATMQKYVGINEQECNNQSYALVLEQMERMTKENEELERLRHKK